MSRTLKIFGNTYSGINTLKAYTPNGIPVSFGELQEGQIYRDGEWVYLNLQRKTVEENGLVKADEGYDGLEAVAINVPNTYSINDENKIVHNRELVDLNLQDKTVKKNGIVNADEGYDGLNSVTINVANFYEPKDENKIVHNSELVDLKLQNKTVTQNGIVQAESNYDGLGIITINVLNTYTSRDENKIVHNNQLVDLNLQSKSTTVNGTITPDTGYDGLSEVIVNISEGNTFGPEDEGKIVHNNQLVDLNLQNKTITENGIVRADVGYDGLSSVIVNIPLTPSEDDGGDSETLVKLINGTLENIENDEVEEIRTYAFNGCTFLTSANFLACTSIGSQAFTGCTSLISANFPACISIGECAFSSCTSLTNVSFPECTSIGSSAFYGCTSLISVNFPACNTINKDAFAYCSRLIQLDITASSVCQLADSTAFISTPIVGYTEYTSGQLGSIYVPASLVDAYKSANNWSYYSDRITSYEEESNDYLDKNFEIDEDNYLTLENSNIEEDYYSVE